MSNRLFSDGVVRRVMHFLGYDTARINHFLIRGTTRDRIIMVEDAVELGFDAERAARFAEEQNRAVLKEKKNGKDYI